MQVEIPTRIRDSTQKQWEDIRELLDSFLAERNDSRTLLLRRTGKFTGKSLNANSKGRKEVIMNARRILFATGVTDNKDIILRNPCGIHGLRDLFYMLTEALNPRDEEAKDMAQALEPKTLKAGFTGMARWPSEKDIETAILKPKEDGPIEWDVDRDSVKKAKMEGNKGRHRHESEPTRNCKVGHRHNGQPIGKSASQHNENRQGHTSHQRVWPSIRPQQAGEGWIQGHYTEDHGHEREHGGHNYGRLEHRPRPDGKIHPVEGYDGEAQAQSHHTQVWDAHIRNINPGLCSDNTRNPGGGD
ncbi:hypothetical protein J8273_6908 [Carpediemonas membranifera]|uniref:Uncharacterized protein n=1 Tax=Carpediemonas membranifera TaxID=201153 RepID=A0A8J6E8F0_9EUKA|nr:hypothetical protein J8273_6908 [Carpediemonas membranifera]|eukprot:KAG9391810.1 hypothetical protein J8273_6908 [Carpediemonas membranifera]